MKIQDYYACFKINQVISFSEEMRILIFFGELNSFFVKEIIFGRRLDGF